MTTYDSIFVYFISINVLMIKVQPESACKPESAFKITIMLSKVLKHDLHAWSIQMKTNFRLFTPGNYPMIFSPWFKFPSSVVIIHIKLVILHCLFI